MPTIDSVQDQVLETLKGAQRIALDAVKTGFEFAESLVQTVGGSASSAPASKPAAK
jgi:hypothetical protein